MMPAQLIASNAGHNATSMYKVAQKVSTITRVLLTSCHSVHLQLYWMLSATVKSGRSMNLQSSTGTSSRLPVSAERRGEGNSRKINKLINVVYVASVTRRVKVACHKRIRVNSQEINKQTGFMQYEHTAFELSRVDSQTEVHVRRRKLQFLMQTQRNNTDVDKITWIGLNSLKS